MSWNWGSNDGDGRGCGRLVLIVIVIVVGLGFAAQKWSDSRREMATRETQLIETKSVDGVTHETESSTPLQAEVPAATTQTVAVAAVPVDYWAQHDRFADLWQWRLVTLTEVTPIYDVVTGRDGTTCNLLSHLAVVAKDASNGEWHFTVEDWGYSAEHQVDFRPEHSRCLPGYYQVGSTPLGLRERVAASTNTVVSLRDRLKAGTKAWICLSCDQYPLFRSGNGRLDADLLEVR